MKLIERKRYMNKLRQLRDVDVIKVVVGARRCGKSVLLQMFRDELRASGVTDHQITYVNFEEPELVPSGQNWRSIYDQVIAKLSPSQSNYVFFDEIQAVPDFERLVDGLQAKPNVDIYITGSNAWFLSSQLATLLSGRYVDIRLLPFSFAEYVSMYDDNPSISHEQLFQNYMNYGAFPVVADLVHSNNLDVVNDYLMGIFNTVMVKDVATRQGTSNTQTATNIIRYMLDNIGNITSSNAIADTMIADHQAVSRPTVANYLDALADAFLLYPVDRFDVKGKKLLTNLAKYYAVDTGLRRAVLGSRASTDVGRMLENIVYLELLRRERTVRVGRIGNKEIDFAVINQAGNTEYYQVAYSVRDESTLQRELGSLRGIDDNPKYLITMDPEERNFDGIQQVNAVKWLLAS